MFRNFIIITLRSLSRNWLYSLINMLGLAVGMACSILIAIYLIHEWGYDKFHEDSERIYRISLEGTIRGQSLRLAVTPLPMAGSLQQRSDEVESAVRIMKHGAWKVSNGEKTYNEDEVFFADSNFLDFFTFPLIHGDKKGILEDKRAILITASTARKYFGTTDITGKKLYVEVIGEKEPFIVKGVLEDVPSNSHFHFDFVIPISAISKYLKHTWFDNQVYTYVKMRSGANISLPERELDEIVRDSLIQPAIDSLGYASESFGEGNNKLRYKFQELEKIHLTSDLDEELEENSKALYVNTFGIIAVLVLIVACMNFINMSTANSTNRAREVVMRKILGADRKLIIYQFLTESVVLSFAALLVALILAEILMPQFNRFLGLELTFEYLKNYVAIGTILLFTLLLGLLAGSYPAIFVSSYKPVKVLHGILNVGIGSRKLRSLFVVIQLTISILIIILSLIVYSQIKHMMGKELGFNHDKVLVIRRSDALKDTLNTFKKDILYNDHIKSVSYTGLYSLPGRSFNTARYTVKKDGVERYVFMIQMVVGHDFFETYEIKLDEGRLFNPESDKGKWVCIINQTAAREIGRDSILHKYLLPPRSTGHKDSFRIIGVVKDFHFESVDKPVDPLVIRLMEKNHEGYLSVRLTGGETDKTISYIEEIWKKYAKDYPFQHFFLQDDYNKNYATFIRTGKLFLIFAILSVFVACLGLFGLILFTSNQRTREISIRKTLGASHLKIILLILRETLFLVAYASAVGWILAYFMGRQWLKDFHSHIQLSPKFFIAASLLVLLLSLSVVLYQAIVAANTNPAASLKENS